MKKLLFIVLATPLLACAMEETNNNNSNDNDEMKSDTFIIHVHNASAVGNYLGMKKNYETFDNWLRESFKTGPIPSHYEFLKKLKHYIKFAQIMDSGEKRFAGKHEWIKTDRKGAMFQIKVHPPIARTTVEEHYLATPYVYKIIAGAKESQRYIDLVRQQDMDSDVEMRRALEMSKQNTSNSFTNYATSHARPEGKREAFKQRLQVLDQEAKSAEERELEFAIKLSLQDPKK